MFSQFFLFFSLALEGSGGPILTATDRRRLTTGVETEAAWRPPEPRSVVRKDGRADACRDVQSVEAMYVCVSGEVSSVQLDLWAPFSFSRRASRGNPGCQRGQRGTSVLAVHNDK